MVVTGNSIEYCEHIFWVQDAADCSEVRDGGPFHHGRNAFRQKSVVVSRYACVTTDLDRGVKLGVLRYSSFSFYLVVSAGKIIPFLSKDHIWR
jgi:hypothetical protein